MTLKSTHIMKKLLYILLASSLIFTACKKDDDTTAAPNPNDNNGSPLPFFTNNCKLSVIYSIRIRDSFKEPYITNYYTGDRLDSSVYYNSKNKTWYEYIAPNKRYRHSYFTSNGTTYNYVKAYQELDDKGNLRYQEDESSQYKSIYHYDTISHGNNRHIRLASIGSFSSSSNDTFFVNYHYTGIRLDSISGFNHTTVYEYMPPMKYTYSIDLNYLNPTKKLVTIEELNPNGTVKFKRDMDDPIFMCEMEYDCP